MGLLPDSCLKGICAMNYIIWKAKNEGNSCLLSIIQNVEDDWQLKKGISRITSFPQDAFFHMDNQYKKNVRLTDNLININSVIVASKRLKEFLEAKKFKNIEYLPVSVINHKDRIASKDYFIIHPITTQDCLDIDKSGCTWSSINPTNIIDVDKLVIDESRIDLNVQLFRLKYFYPPVFVRKDLAEEITQAGFTGLLWLELDEYGK